MKLVDMVHRDDFQLQKVVSSQEKTKTKPYKINIFASSITLRHQFIEYSSLENQRSNRNKIDTVV